MKLKITYLSNFFTFFFFINKNLTQNITFGWSNVWQSSRTDVGQTFEKRKLNKSSTFVKCYKLAPFYESMSYGRIVKRSTQSQWPKSLSMNDTQNSMAAT